jgi:hypothetical protein
MIDGLTRIAQVVLFFAALFIMFRVFALGVRYGYHIAIQVQIDKELKQTTQAPIRHEYYEEQKALVEEANYKKWCRRYGLRVSADTRALYNDTDYRMAIEAQDSNHA